jgi:hypothetical protein
MPTLPPPDPRQANREEAAAALVAFGREVFGGGLRWLATVFTAASAVLLIGMYAGILPDETYWPVRTRGTTATLLVVSLLAFWTVIAGVNWRSHARRRLRA